MTGTHSDELRGIKLDDERILFTHDWESEADLGVAITDAVARLTDVPHERIATERATVDFDALNRLFRPPPDGALRAGGQLMFRLEGCAITVRSDGLVTVEHDR